MKKIDTGIRHVQQKTFLADIVPSGPPDDKRALRYCNSVISESELASRSSSQHSPECMPLLIHHQFIHNAGREVPLLQRNVCHHIVS